MRSHPRLTSIIIILLAAAALGAIAQGDGWRSAALAGVAGAAVLATRIRFAPVLALVAVAAVAGLALTGRGVVQDARAVAPAHAKHAKHAAKHHRHHHPAAKDKD